MVQGKMCSSKKLTCCILTENQAIFCRNTELTSHFITPIEATEWVKVADVFVVITREAVHTWKFA